MDIPTPHTSPLTRRNRPTLPSARSHRYSAATPLTRAGNSGAAPASPVLSVITPVAPHKAQYLSKTASSIQELRNILPSGFIEWILVVDGIGELPESSANADVVIQHPANLGVSAARNTGLNASRGAFITPLDADDRISSGVVAIISEMLKKPQFGWAAGNRVDLASGKPTKHWFSKRREWSVGSFVKTDATGTLPFHPNSLVVRRDVALSVGGWNEQFRFGEDLLFAALCSEAAPGVSIPAIITLYRQWSGQTVRSKDYREARNGGNLTAILREVAAFRNDYGRTAVMG